MENKNGNPRKGCRLSLERVTRFELATFCLEGRSSTVELYPHYLTGDAGGAGTTGVTGAGVSVGVTEPPSTTSTTTGD